MNKKLLRLAAGIVAVFLFAVPCAAAETPYQGYTYDENSTSHAAINGYDVSNVVMLNTVGGVQCTEPVDMFVADSREEIYIVDQGENAVFVFDTEYNFLRVYKEFRLSDGTVTTLNKPSSVFVNNEGRLYIADTGNYRILISDTDSNVELIIGTPDEPQYADNIEFQPTKILVNSSGSIYTIVRGVSQGALVFTPDGAFQRYFGSNKVKASFKVITDWMWKQIMNDEQRQSMARYVPVEFLSFDMDSMGFVYTVSNQMGDAHSRLTKFDFLSNNVVPNAKKFGDLESVTDSGYVYTYPNDVSVDDYGCISILDFQRGRVFRYSSEMDLLFVFGRSGGGMAGTFQNPVAVDNYRDRTLVLDSGNLTVTEFSANEFGQKVINALELYESGKYADSIEPWREIAASSEQFTLAYSGIADAEYMLGNYKSAMDNYKLADDRDGYLRAYRMYRTDKVRENFYILFIVIVLAILLLVLYLIKKKRNIDFSGNKIYRIIKRFLNPIVRPVGVMCHPVISFEGIGYYKQESVIPACIWLAILFFSGVAQYRYTGFAFNNNVQENFNVFMTLFQTVILASLFVVINWLVASLAEGKGHLKEIFVSTVYALAPYILSVFIVTIASHFVVSEEYLLLQFVSYLGIIWSAALLVLAYNAIHDYSTVKSVLIILISIFGVLVVLFFVVLILAVYQQVTNIAMTIWNEIMYRIKG